MSTEYDYDTKKGILQIKLNPVKDLRIQDKTPAPGGKMCGPTADLLSQLRSHNVACATTGESANDPNPLIIIVMNAQRNLFIKGVALFDKDFSKFLQQIASKVVNTNKAPDGTAAQSVAETAVDAKKMVVSDTKVGLSGVLKFTAFAPPAAEQPVGITAAAAPVLTVKK